MTSARRRSLVLPLSALAALGALTITARAGAATLSVGPGQTYTKPCAAIAAAMAGDTIEVDAAGSYDGDTCAWTTDDLTVRGINGRAKIDLTGVAPAQTKGIFVIYANNATVENFELSGAAISAGDGNNGAGIRHQGTNLTVTNCYFHDNQDGILAAPATALTGTVTITGSEFAHNGAGDGYSHNMYINNYAKFVLQSSYSHHGNVGHLVKSRAVVTELLYNRITDETDGTASYEVDIPNGGTGILIGNVIEQSATTQNPNIVSFGEEGVPSGYDDHLYVVSNTIVNDNGGGTFVTLGSAVMSAATLDDDLLAGPGTATSQGSAVQMNIVSEAAVAAAMFVDASTYDYHLLLGSPAIDKGADPGSAAGMSLLPKFAYEGVGTESARTTVGTALDVGAYEYGDTGSVVDGGSATGGSGTTGGGPPSAGSDGGATGDPSNDTNDGGATGDASNDTNASNASNASSGGCATSGANDDTGALAFFGLGIFGLAARLGRRRHP